MTHKDALEILDGLGNSPNMKKHGLGVGFAMTALYDYFQSAGKNPEMSENDWEVVGLLHDADYEATNKSLELHTEETTKKLRERNVDEMIIASIRGHCDKAPRNTLMAKSVYACDELAGLVVACALVQPEKKLSTLTHDSVMRKFRDGSFAKGANRDQIKSCERELGIPIDRFVDIILAAMQEKHDELGL